MSNDNGLNGGNVIDIQLVAARNKARAEFIQRWASFRDHTEQMHRSIAATPGAFSGPIGQWISLTQFQIIRAHNWSKEVLAWFINLESTKDEVPAPAVCEPKPMEFTNAGVATLRFDIEKLGASVFNDIDWAFVTSEFQLAWTKKRTDQVWQAMTEASQWVDQAIETLHSLQHKEQ